MSPRISFSYDLSQSDTVPVDQYLLRSISSSTVDFDFCVHDGFNQESSSADELFSGGKILPTEVKKKTITPKQEKPPPPPPPPAQPPRSKGSNETTSQTASSEPDDHKKSFWRFKRSSSLNCGSGYGRSLCPLPPLLRSNSTGSAASGKRSGLSKDGLNQKKSGYGNGYQKPPLNKSGYGNGVRVNPVLNVPPANLFGLGSIFSGNKDKNKKK